MRGVFATILAVFLALPVILTSSASGEELLGVLRKLEEIEQRLGRIEGEIHEINGAMSRLAAGEKDFDVRETPEYKALEKQFRELQEKLEAQTSRNPAEIWRAMGDAKEVALRLEMLREAFAPTISDANQRREFEQEIRDLKDKIGKEVSDEELYARLRNWLSERLKESSSEREKAWLNGQLETLEKSEGPEREEMIARFIRIENVRAIHELARNYSIPRELMVSKGFPFVGYGGRPPRRREGSDRPGPPRGGGPRGNSRGRREP